MARRNESLIETLMMAPWWISAILAAISEVNLWGQTPNLTSWAGEHYPLLR
jgi:hypothetical protein